jgi:putative hydrolase of the HAD superfamily
MNIRGVVFDYGNVLSLPAIGGEHETIARISGLKPDVLDLHYWNHRRAYDAGDLDGSAFWNVVARDAATSFTAETISQLIHHDIRMWTGLNPTMVDWALRLHRSGIRVGVLSNIGEELVVAMEEQFDWLHELNHNVWSCRVRLTKPDPAIYKIHPRHFGLTPAEILFLDDREENVTAARSVGYQAIVFRDVQQLRAELESRGILNFPAPFEEPVGTPK